MNALKSLFGGGGKKEDEKNNFVGIKDNEPLPTHDLTKRKKVVKLELPTENVPHQLELVAKTVYNFEQPISTKGAYNNWSWHATDELFDTAYKSYQSVIIPFTELPRVHKLESTKDKLFQYRLSLVKQPKRAAKIMPAASNKKQGIAKWQLKKNAKNADEFEDDDDFAKKTDDDDGMTKEERLEIDLKTFINPFLPPKPWKRQKNRKGEVQYLNVDTKEVRTLLPGEVWEEKYKNMQKLTPRYIYIYLYLDG